MSEAKRPKRKSKSTSITTQRRMIVITVDDDHLARIDHVAGELRSLGVKVEEILKATGLICGTTDSPLAELKKVPGVMSVEDQSTFDVPPSDSPVH